MTKRNNKRALVLSLLSLLLCCSMLVGTTFAWFTDSVTSGVNKIVAGNLDVDVFYGDPEDKKSIEGVSTLFNDVTLWEPGAVAYENLTVANLGTLALKYELSVSFANENYIMVDGQPEYSLPDILQVGLVPGGIADGLDRDAVVEAVDAWYPMESYTWEDELLANTNEETMGVVIWWEPSAEDNNWNLNNGKVTNDEKDHLYVDLGITLVATQLVEENDSFDNTYDESAEYPAAVGGTLEEGATEDLTLNVGRVTVTVPAGSPAGGYKLNVDSLSLTVDDEDKGDLDTNFSVLKDGVPTEGVEYAVQIQVDIMSKDLTVTHKGEEITDFEYDPFTGVVSFTTDSFSPFTVDYTIFGKEVKLEGEKILSGFFTEVDPVTLDATLDGGDYMVVDFEKDGKTVYSVSEKATTVIVDPTYSGKLWSVVTTDMSKNIIGFVPETVYLLPGTYNEGTTINVCASMNIIGLGDTEEVKVVKTSSSSSNRHLFNCNGTKADYIEVTIRNMTLDATAKTTNSKDNAAVQSIRKTKVKCYDLNIIKGSGFDAVAFYVNGNNAVDGVKYPAYLYVENCSLNTTRTFGIVTTSGSYKFYHNGVTYNNGTAYTKNSGSVKNIPMEWNDWDWEN